MNDPMPSPRTAPRSALIVLALALTAGIFGFAAIGEGGPISGRVAVVLAEMVYSGWMPLIYLLGAFGYGCVLCRALNPLHANRALCMSIGLAAMLTLTHLLGITGLLTPITAWASTAIGCLLAAFALRKSSMQIPLPRDPYAVVMLALLLVGVGVYVVSAASPPGALFDSEFGAYDSLSYHLQLPKEWIADGRIWPSAHNVYTYHPGYIESSYMHLSLLGNQRLPLQSTHFFSVLLVLIAAWNAGSAVRRWGGPELAAILASAALVLTPWVLVVGSISYNEPGVLALGAGALLVASESKICPPVSGLLAAILVGGACGCKMTTIFFLAPSVAVLLLASTPKKSWLPLVTVGGFASIAMVAPWLIRNTIASGNPVFPHADSLFGGGHWTNEQLARFSGAHKFDGTIIDRFAMLVLSDPSAPPGVHVARFRGLTNLQWGLLPIATLGGLVSLLLLKPTRRTGVVMLIAVLIPIMAWLSLTHLQSRFFVPMVPLAACVVGLGFGHMPLKKPALLLALASLGSVAVVFASQRQGNPNALLTIGTLIHTDPVMIDGQPSTLTWTASLNATVSTDETVYLLGDATGFYLRPRVVYNTTYDTPAIAPLIEQFPSQPARWIGGLKNLGIDWVVINTGELDRLNESGWIDPSISPQRINELTDTLVDAASIKLDPSRTAYRIADFPSP